MNKAPTTTVRGRGRPQGESTTREDILRVARRRFLADGYERVTLRSVAAEAGVDVALISYFYGSKSGLFGATMRISANPARLIEQATHGDLASLPDRLLTKLVTTWDDPDVGAGLRAMAEAATREPEVSRVLREMVQTEIVARIAERVGGTDATARAGVVASQALGIIFGRYVLRIEPLVSMPADELVARVAPAMRAALSGPRRPTAPDSPRGRR
jgi:AcrR family transcriptional regulator